MRFNEQRVRWKHSFTYTRAEIDYGFAEALTNIRNYRVKVWIYKGELMAKDVEKEKRRE